jgi:hypothetical protein
MVFFLPILRIRHLDKAEPARLAGVVIHHDLDPLSATWWAIAVHARRAPIPIVEGTRPWDLKQSLAELGR